MGTAPVDRVENTHCRSERELHFQSIIPDCRSNGHIHWFSVGRDITLYVRLDIWGWSNRDRKLCNTLLQYIRKLYGNAYSHRLEGTHWNLL